MFSNNSLLGYGLLTAFICIGGVQDWYEGEVDNWITLPLFFMGLLAVLLRVIFAKDMPMNALSLFAILVVTVAVLKGWMGGADWKTLVGLFGVWPLAGFAALTVAGGWGAILILWSGNRNARFPGVTVFAISAILTFIVELSIMPLN